MKSKNFGLRGLLTALMLCFMLSAVAQVSVKGIVQDKSGEPLIGATVQEKGNTANGTATGIDGDFSLKVKSAKATLLVSYVGMKSQEVALDGRTEVTIVLQDDTELLEEVVVVGYGTQRKSDITGSVARISEEQMKQSIVTNADQMLQGKVAGV
ncbi:carboxypeptidase-like regulatory domain-containing protein, partial [Duncaniella muris]|uniref:carboxypeptidase-like regulatory domain-containing protein n=1 Tax=Duncaniella muris TaxID=2094150 RepID=UPI00260B2EEE